MPSEPRPLRAAIVAVGNELLSGQTTDTNGAWLAVALTEVGVHVGHHLTVGDTEEDIREALGRALEHADLVVITGGLGPTPDDRTKAAVARHFGRDLVPDPRVLEAIETRFRLSELGEVPRLSRAVADVPVGSQLLPNEWGTAPGLHIQEGEAHVFLLPGVPRELKGIFSSQLRAIVEDLARASGVEAIHHRLIHTTGLPEPKLAERIEARWSELPEAHTAGVELAYLPDLRGVDLRFTLRGGSKAAAAERFAHLLAALDSTLDGWRYDAVDGDLATSVVHALAQAGASIAVAESCTGGLLAKRLTDAPGASAAFLGGVIAYSNEVKVSQLGISTAHLERHGAVSEVVARQMAAGVAERFAADAAISITGVAGPGGGSEEKPVGTVWIGVSWEGDVTAFRTRFGGDREAVRERAAQAALAALYHRLGGPAPRA